MEAFKKTVLIPIILVVLVFAIEAYRSGLQDKTQVPSSNAPVQNQVSQSQMEVFRQQALLAAKPAATSTLQLQAKYRKDALSKYASSTYNPSSVKPNNI